MKIPLKDVLDMLTDIKHQNDHVKQKFDHAEHRNDHFMGNLQQLFKEFFTNQHLIIKKIDRFMQTTQERFDAILGRLDNVTNTIADNYKNLVDSIKKGTVSEASLKQAEDDITKLEAIGKPADPAGDGTGTGTTDPGTGTAAGGTVDTGAGAGTTTTGGTTAGDVVNPDGSVTHADGSITNADGSVTPAPAPGSNG